MQRSMDMKEKKKSSDRITVSKTLPQAQQNIEKCHCQRTVSAADTDLCKGNTLSPGWVFILHTPQNCSEKI